MKKSIVRTSLALAIAGVLGTSVVAYAAEAPQIQPVPVVKQETVQSAPAVKQEATENKGVFTCLLQNFCSSCCSEPCSCIYGC